MDEHQFTMEQPKQGVLGSSSQPDKTGLSAPDTAAGCSLTLAWWLPLGWQDTLSQLAIEPELHADEWFAPLLRQLAPGLWAGQHVTDASLGEAQHLQEGNHREMRC